MIPKSPAELASDEQFRSELRNALSNPDIQTAIASLQFHRGLLRFGQSVAPTANVYHSALWASGFNSAFDALEAMTKAPSKVTPDLLPYEHIEPQD